MQAILDNSTSPYAQLLASSSLIKIVTEHSLGTPVKLEMRTYFLNYLDRWVLRCAGLCCTAIYLCVVRCWRCAPTTSAAP